MRILFLTDNFPPEVNAPATRTYEHCKEWVKAGMKVTIITCAPNFPEGKIYAGYKNKLIQKETIDGIKVIRVWTYVTANEGQVKRILDYLSFMVASFLVGLFVKTDVIIGTSPQFFTAISARWLSFWKRKPWIMEVRDLWPESIVSVGASKRNLIIRFFEYLEKRMYRTASKIVVVTDSFRKTIIEKHHIDEAKIEVVKNGANLDLFQPSPKDTELISSLGLQNKFIIGYIGTHGMAHALDFVLRSAKNIQNPSIHFLLIGSGAMKKDLIQLKNKLGLTNVTMLDAIGKADVKRYTSILDAGLVNLKKSDTFKSVIPSKIFELAAMNKPILHGVEGESAKIIEEYQIGLTFIPEDERDFFRKIEQIKDMQFNYDKILLDFNRKELAKKLLNFIQQ
ncbi:MAG: glycosyltransferase family 4 protein [Crocinitomicaceae bacterium]